MILPMTFGTAFLASVILALATYHKGFRKVALIAAVVGLAFVTWRRFHDVQTIPSATPNPAIDISAGLVPKPEFVHPCPHLPNSCVTMLTPDKQSLVEVQSDKEIWAEKARFQIVLLKPISK